MNISPLFLRVWPGCEMAVWDRSDHITAWVLHEQGRWFESEMTMLPRLLEPGATFVDVGANVGVYSIAAAHFVGPTGRVVAFEPTEEARSLLEASARRNGFEWLVIRSEALSDHVGRAELFFDDETELASLSHSTSGAARSVSVPLNTLDAVHADLGLGRTNLLKIDVEGAEEAVLRGAREFLAASEPVILHEIKVGTKVDLRVAKWLADAGFAAYRQIPGLDVLVPFALDGFVDPYQLNLFAVARSRAAELAERGVLADKLGTVPDVGLDRGAVRLEKLPYARHLSARWQGAPSADKRLWTALALHAYAHEEERAPAAERWAALERALSLALERLNESATVPRLLTVARLAAETGMRGLAVRTVRDALEVMRSGEADLLDEPFLLPDHSFESVRPTGPAPGLVLYATLAAHERLRAFSSAFTGTEGIAELRLADLFGYFDSEMSRRLKLLEQRAAIVAR
ncbi:MAG: FkbM family methyltransferase [Polyangiaceae bacterium]|nr:FkbM family methyltransferase [Polyangiaceae bacterium]